MSLFAEFGSFLGNVFTLPDIKQVRVKLRKINMESARKQRLYIIQKSPQEAFYRKSCSWKFRNIHTKTSVLESLFNKVAYLRACSFTKKRLQGRCFPANIVKFLRTSILKNICERLLLEIMEKFIFKNICEAVWRPV